MSIAEFSIAVSLFWLKPTTHFGQNVVAGCIPGRASRSCELLRRAAPNRTQSLSPQEGISRGTVAFIMMPLYECYPAFNGIPLEGVKHTRFVVSVWSPAPDEFFENCADSRGHNIQHSLFLPHDLVEEIFHFEI